VGFCRPLGEPEWTAGQTLNKESELHKYIFGDKHNHVVRKIYPLPEWDGDLVALAESLGI
jgi:hypothetical protein